VPPWRPLVSGFPHGGPRPPPLPSPRGDPPTPAEPTRSRRRGLPFHLGRPAQHPQARGSMPAPATIDDFLGLVRKSNQVDNARLDAYLKARRDRAALPADPRKLAALLVRKGFLTAFQAEQFLLGKYKGFHAGGYHILERLGSGGNGTVSLAEHEAMRRRVALKVLPADIADQRGVLERFLREARAAAALD